MLFGEYNIKECNYTEVIKYYQEVDKGSVDIDAQVTKIRLKYLYDLYYSFNEETRNMYIKRIEGILKNRLNIKISLEDRVDKTIELGVQHINDSKDKRFLGEILPIILTLEKELVCVTQNEANANDNIENWMYNYLSRYDKLKLNKENYDVYDIFNAYATKTKKIKFILGIINTQIKAIPTKIKKKINRRNLWMIF